MISPTAFSAARASATERIDKARASFMDAAIELGNKS
jgi:hypothetical protein